MKRKSIFVWKLLAVLCGLSLAASPANCNATQNDPGVVAYDAILVRPVCFLATICGSAIFVISLPIAATSRSIPETARALVLKPAHATFTRPLGDVEYMANDDD